VGRGRSRPSLGAGATAWVGFPGQSGGVSVDFSRNPRTLWRRARRVSPDLAGPLGPRRVPAVRPVPVVPTRMTARASSQESHR
jgi:hypothetical protein